MSFSSGQQAFALDTSSGPLHGSVVGAHVGCVVGAPFTSGHGEVAGGHVGWIVRFGPDWHGGTVGVWPAIAGAAANNGSSARAAAARNLRIMGFLR
jgi:hypothetical protein